MPTTNPFREHRFDLTALERYRRTILFEQFGLAPMLIRAFGGGASQFSLNGGTPTTSVGQFDIGMFVNDDWHARRNVTISYGLRYETQTNIQDFSDWAPRAAIAWGFWGARVWSSQIAGESEFGNRARHCEATYSIARNRRFEYS